MLCHSFCGTPDSVLASGNAMQSLMVGLKQLDIAVDTSRYRSVGVEVEFFHHFVGK
jgi:hypothetical protein